MEKCPLVRSRLLDDECLTDECAWWDELEGRCIVVSVGRKMAVIGNWILLEKLLKQPIAPIR